MKWALGSRARSRHRSVVAVGEEPPGGSQLSGEGLRQSCWANLPVELWREVLIRMEESEAKWPSRKSVVACAGVCRSWRAIIKAAVQTPQASGKMTFPISVKQPGPRGSLMQCFIKRNKFKQTYHLYLSLTQALASDDGKLLLAARKYRRATCTDYIISLHADDISQGLGGYIGKLRSNFPGTKFIVYDGSSHPHHGDKVGESRSTASTRVVAMKQVVSGVPAENHEVAHISYELNVLGARGPRRMHCVMDSIPASAIKPGGVAPTQTDFPIENDNHSFSATSFSRPMATAMEKSLSGPLELERQTDQPLVLRNKNPRWHEQLQCWCLNFHGRVTVASVKNFQLVAASPENGAPPHEKVILQFGKVAKDVYTMDFRYPLSAFLAFAICLSSFDTKIACQ
ncbi:unnamed protein product [Cuscuta epithymum]|uniref:Tubby-like F-box protein n=1 Tax=Cuscuta epithymum TaxID=186058 RepID=A0AAV0FLZ5_9ASTE|nr:unnamed protein product [Cuscuta epithymum]